MLVKINRHHPIGARPRDEVGHELRADRDPWLILPILPGVAVIRNHRSNPRRAGTECSVQHNEQLQQVFGGRVGGLNDEKVSSPDVLVDPDKNLTVCKPLDRDVAQRLVQAARNLLSKGAIRRPCEEHQLALRKGSLSHNSLQT